jgi:hypothetical protein
VEPCRDACRLACGMLRAVLLAGFTPALRQGSAFQGSAVSTRATSRMTGPVMADAWVRVVPSDTVPANGQADRLVAGAGAFVSVSCFEVRATCAWHWQQLVVNLAAAAHGVCTVFGKIRRCPSVQMLGTPLAAVHRRVVRDGVPRGASSPRLANGTGRGRRCSARLASGTCRGYLVRKKQLDG